MYIRSVLLIFLVCGTIAAQPADLTLHFADLEVLVDETSPSIRLSEKALRQISASRSTALQWSNPELGYIREYVQVSGTEEQELQIYLSKRFDNPWNFWNLQKSWSNRYRSAQHSHNERRYQILAEVRGGYVELSLTLQLIQTLSNYHTLIQHISQTLEARKKEGAVSGLEMTLVRYVLFLLNSDINDLQKQFRRRLTDWKQTSGIDEDVEVVFATPVAFKEFDPKALTTDSLAGKSDGIQARNFMQIALEQQVTVEKGKILPDLSITAGIKKVEPDLNGYVIGLSIPLPLVSLNGGAVEQARVNLDTHQLETQIYMRRLQDKIRNVLAEINADINLLKSTESDFSETQQLLENLAFSWQEGAISLTDFLNGMQILKEAHSRYVMRLSDYYRNLFDLESVSGQKLVSF